MRKLIYAINMTLDGCVDHMAMLPDEGLQDYYMQMVRGSDLLVYGRKTYQLMDPYWPEVAANPEESKADRDFGQAYVAAKKLVFSRTLATAEGHTRIVRGNLRDELLKAKQEAGKDILVSGVDIASQLIELGVVDEYRFVVQPIIAGAGRRLMEGVHLAEKLRLKLIESTISKSGSAALHYVKQ